MTSRLAALLLMTLPALLGQDRAAWQSAPPLPRPMAAFAMGVESSGSVVVVGGSYWQDSARQLAPEIWQLAPGDKAWRRVGSLPTGLAYAATATDREYLWVAGGVTPDGLDNAVRCVDLRTGQVRTIATLPAPRSHAGATVHHGRLWILGGLQRASDLTSADAAFLVVDLTTGEIRSLPPPPIDHVINPALVPAAERLWVFPGSRRPPGTTGLHTFEHALEFDPATETWLQHPLRNSLPRGLAVAAISDSTVWLAGGVDVRTDAPARISDRSWLYDLKAHTLREGPRLPGPRLAFGWAQQGQSIILAGGEPASGQRTDAVSTHPLP